MKIEVPQFRRQGRASGKCPTIIKKKVCVDPKFVSFIYFFNLIFQANLFLFLFFIVIIIIIIIIIPFLLFFLFYFILFTFKAHIPPNPLFSPYFSPFHSHSSLVPLKPTMWPLTIDSTIVGGPTTLVITILLRPIERSTKMIFETKFCNIFRKI